MEIDSEIGVSVHWVWLGHSAVSRVGGVSDFNVDILLELLRGVNWFVQRHDAIESVEGYEQAALKAAQEKRRNRAIGRSGGKLKEVRIPEPPPLSIEGKKLVHRVGVARAGYLAAVDEANRKQMSAAAAKPKPPEFRAYKANKSVPCFGLTGSKGTIIAAWIWSTFHEKEEMMDKLCADPAGTYTHLTVYGLVFDEPDRWREAWESTRSLRRLAAEIPPS
ncbi:hypothetical protein [Oleiharenicola lentus]|nr:hypothetical protein [Oleiharenicola lentus]